MARPVPNSTFLSDLARRIQKTLKRQINMPTLLAATPSSKIAVVAGMGEKCLHLFNQETGHVTVRLPLPPRTRSSLDYRAFRYHPNGRTLCGYNKYDGTFVVWSMEDGAIRNTIGGERKLAPAMEFIGELYVAVSDGSRVHVAEVGGPVKHHTFLSEDLRSITFYTHLSKPNLLFVVASVKRGKSGFSLICLHVQDGKILSSGEGPFRGATPEPGLERDLLLHELAHIPGSTQKVLVTLEEERLRPVEGLDEDARDDVFRTRLVGLDPLRPAFYRDELVLEGRFCLEASGSELHMVDELGRRRRVEGFPLRLTSIDWRLD